MDDRHHELRARIAHDIDELLRRSGVLAGHLRNTTREVPGDWEERASVLENDEVLEGLEDTVRAELAELRQVLARIDGGTYGACASCGEPISARRLAARPTATLCIDCASARERA